MNNVIPRLVESIVNSNRACSTVVNCILSPISRISPNCTSVTRWANILIIGTRNQNVIVFVGNPNNYIGNRIFITNSDCCSCCVISSFLNNDAGILCYLWSSESSSWNEGQHECCHGSQRYNLLRDLIQLYSLPINFLRNLAPPQWGAGLFSLHPAWSVPHFSCTSFSSARVLPQAKQETFGVRGTRRPLPPCTSTTASAVASGTGRIIPAWRYAVAVFPLPIT